MPQIRAKHWSRVLFKTFAVLVTLGLISPILGTDAASATPTTHGAFAPAALNTGQYREGTDQAAAIFDPLAVNRIDLTVPQASVDYMNQHASGAAPGSHGDYQPAQMTFTNAATNETTNLMDVGIRLKGGWGSARNLDQKPAFKIKMNYSVKGQTLYGLKKLTLNNMVQDLSMLHEVVGYRLFRAAGVPASRAGYVNVYLNGQNLGLHLNLETYDLVSLARHFGTTTHLYEGAYWQDVVNSQYDAMQVDEGDATNKADLRALASVNTIDPYNPTQVANWYNEVQKYADLNEMLTEWAVERYIAHWDGYAWTIKNNYYVHFTAQGIASILPSGIDQTSTGNLGMLDANSAAQMFVNCMASSPCTALYLGAINKVRTIAQSLNLDQMIQDVQGAISPSVESDPRKSESINDFNWAVQDSRNFHAGRPADVDRQTNTNVSSNANLTYTYGSFTPGATFAPTLTRVGTATVVYSVVNGGDKCSIDSTTGVVTVIKLGWCRVSVRVSAIRGFGASLAYFTFLPGSVPGSASIQRINDLAYDSSVAVTVSADSAVMPVLTVEGPCTIEGNFLKAAAGSGSCVVTAKVASDGTYTAATATTTVKLIRAQAATYEASGTPGYTSKALPKGGVIKLVRKPLKVSGACSVSGTSLKALADKGTCTVSFAKFNDALFDYAAQTTRIHMVSATQTWPKGVKAAGTFSYPDGIQLTAASPVITNWYQEAQIITDGNCQTLVDGTGATWAFDDTGATCKVTMSVGKLFGLKGLTRTWVLKP